LSYGGKGEPQRRGNGIQAADAGRMGFYSAGQGWASSIAALMIQGAWLRLLARDQVVAGLPIRFGADELRLLVVNIVLWLLIMAAGVLTIVLYAVVNAGFAMGGEPGGVAVQALVNTLLTVIVIVGWIIFLLGLAPRASADRASARHQDL
jgi:heme/copper-type cytochrome/quinol oxidase subunit 2